MYLRQAAEDGAVVSTGALLSVQAVVEAVSVAGVHTAQTDVQLVCDAAPQVQTAAGELNRVKGQRGIINICLFMKRELFLITYNVDESREKDDDDGEDAHQGAVESGLDDPLREGLQGDGEQLGGTEGKMEKQEGN